MDHSRHSREGGNPFYRRKVGPIKVKKGPRVRGGDGFYPETINDNSNRVMAVNAPSRKKADGLFRQVAASMFMVVVVVMAVPALANPDAVLDYADARHLLARTGFGPTDAEVRAFTGLTRRAAVERLLSDAPTTTTTPVPTALTASTPIRPPRGPDASVEERKAFVQEQVQEGLELRAWWLQEMLTTPSPLTERMTLFWHNHFVSAQPKVRVTRLMLQQNQTLRANALGRFDTLLHAVAKDPAMIVYLDGAQNRRGAPNENFAREVMELFTLGEGKYREEDIKEAARAFTGWTIDRDSGTFVMRRALHDDGPKTVFGQTGRFDGDAILDLLLARPETSEWVVTKLWREFVSPDPQMTEVKRIALRFRRSDYDIKVALAELLQSDAFYAPENRGVLVKSPAELVVGTLRQLDLNPAQTLPFALAAAQMGQNLFSPPNVKGWPGGETWINTTTLLARKQFLERLTRGSDANAVGMTTPAPGPVTTAMEGAAKVPRQVLAPNGGMDPEKVRAQRFAREMDRGLRSVPFDGARWMVRLPGAATPERNAAAERLLLATAPQQPLDPQADAATFVRALLLDAAYQLK